MLFSLCRVCPQPDRDRPHQGAVGSDCGRGAAEAPDPIFRRGLSGLCLGEPGRGRLRRPAVRGSGHRDAGGPELRQEPGLVRGEGRSDQLRGE